MPRLLLLLALFAPELSAEEPTPLRTRAAASDPEGDLPAYAARPPEELPDWLTLGFDFRTRSEDRSGRLRGRSEPSELALGLTRARLFFGVAPESSPFAVAAELMDARQFATDVPETPLTVNELDLLQLRLDVDLTRAFRVPVSVELGRTSFDAVDRRLVARNRFRNTVNAFDGARLAIGSGKLEILALWPTERQTGSLDAPAEGRKLFGAVARLDRSAIALEPYYFFYEANRALPSELHTTGVHAFGPLGERWDHDLDVALQLGNRGVESHRALAFHGELGARFGGAWAPRLSAWLNYASGDGAPDDGRSERFDPLFGASHAMYGFTDLFTWQNLVNPTVAVTLRPSAAIRVSVMHRFFWLASSTDAFVRAGLVDPEGRSGSFVGQELDLELSWSLLRFADLNVQYGELFAGSFVERTGGGTGARVFYVTLTVTSS